MVTEFNQTLLLAHDFAIPGGHVDDVKSQILNRFIPNVVEKPAWASWMDKISFICTLLLFSNVDLVTWIGINDVIHPENLGFQVNELFKLQERIYDAGARNFVFLTVPPIDRTPRYGILLLDRKES